MVWEKVKSRLQATLADSAYQLWIEPIELVQFQNSKMYLSCPDRYFSAYVKQNFLTAIEKQLDEEGASGTRVIFCEAAQKSKSRMSAKSRPAAPKPTQLRLPSVPENNSRFRSLHPRYTFDEFMVGESNILAESACRSMIVGDDLLGSCLYINSETGLGKSHLTHAVAHQVYSQSPMTRLHYLTATQFAQEMIRGIQNRSMDDFKSKYHDHCDILLVEDIHTLDGKKKTQEELNDLLDHLIKCGKRVILTSNRAPRELKGIDNEFRSRMSSGLVTSIKAPDINTRLRIVEKKAATQDLRLNGDMIDFLAQSIRGDVRRIESALIGLRAKAQLQGGFIDMDLVRSVVASVAGESQVLTASMICELVCGQFNVSVKELQSKSRKKSVTVPRQIAMYLARKFTEESLAEIGRAFNRDHSTVLHSIKVVTNKVVRDNSMNAQLELLTNKVRQI